MKNLCFFAPLILLGLTSIAGAEIRYTGASLRDPFSDRTQPKKAAEPEAPSADVLLQSLTIQGVLASAKNPRAIINDKIFRVGSEVLPGVKITRIQKKGVFVTVGEKEVFLSQQIPTTTRKGA